MSIASITALYGPSRGDIRDGIFRGGGIGDAKACRTVRRWTPNLSANARTDSPSTREARRISANNSTFDPCRARSS
ncbi:hypothetical protein GCM10009862_08590 [Microbacterium binotii]|uniref:Uncharacterized protein n=1 Tax=Microbacterium binotii TaxID=462710 RepID=A0ABP6BL04_9MICO